MTLPITASCGIATTTDPKAAPEELLAEADKAMYRAKEESKKHSPRPSTLSVAGGSVEVVRR